MRRRLPPLHRLAAIFPSSMSAERASPAEHPSRNAPVHRFLTWGVLLAVFIAFGAASAQHRFSDIERAQGYRVERGRATFIFDEAVYGFAPEKVMLEGAMRKWEHRMDDPEWELRRSDEQTVWTLEKELAPGGALAPGMEFKFRAGDGRWLDPPAEAANRRGGNLVFEPAAASARLRAELAGPRDIRLTLSGGDGTLSLDPSAYRLTNARGESIAVAAVLRIGHDEVQVSPAQPLDIARVHFIEDVRTGLRALCSFSGWMRHLYSGKELGANHDPAVDKTVFRVLAPRATEVRLYLYKDRAGDPPLRVVRMLRDNDGVWEAVLDGNAEGTWYDFTVHGPTDPGNEFYEQKPVHVGDPYARVSDDSFGRARVWPKTRPARPLAGGIPKMEDVIAYEVHVEDFTLAIDQLDSAQRGTFAGFARTGLRNSRGVPVGIDHLVDLGINVAHLLPVQEYLHYPDGEWRAAFADDPYMRERGIAESNYDWGYRTSHAMAIETRYRERGTDHGAQNEQFRDLVQALHDRGIAVVADVVFNHTAERIDNREYLFHMRALDRHLYYRTDERLEFIGEYGTETKSEDRPMTARWIYDQCRMLIDEYGVDGFRIDLAGLTDQRTLEELRRRIGPDKIVYGEPWIGSGDPDYEANPDWDWYKADAPITFFQDDCRNALCGPPDNPRDKRSDRGYAGGNGNREAAKRAIANAFEHEDTPNEGINYLDIHDNWALADRFAARDWNGELGVDEGPYRIAAAMLLTSLGPVVLHGGSEFMRSKGSAPLEEVVKHTAGGPIYLHGKRDSYNLRAANLFRWENLGRNRSDGAPCDYQRMNDYWKGLIALRKSPAGKVFRIGTTVPDGYIQWLEPPDPMQLGYMVAETVFVLVNTAVRDAIVENLLLPAGTWKLVAQDDIAGTTPIPGQPDSELRGETRVSITVPATSVKIWVKIP